MKRLAAALLLCAPAAGAEQSAYSAAISAYIDCGDDYVATALRMNWSATAGDLADAALESCDGKAKLIERTVISDPDIRMPADDAEKAVEHITASLRRTLVRHVVEYRNRPLSKNK